MQVIVVGGGIVGLSIAFAGLGRGFGVTLIDDGAGEAASWGNAGHIAIEQVAPLASIATLRGLPRRLVSKNGGLGLPLADIAEWLPFGARLALAARPQRFGAGKSALTSLLGQAMPAWERLVAGIGQADLLRKDGHFLVWESPRSAAAGLRHWLAADTGSASVRPAGQDELRAIAALMRTPPAGAARCEGSGQIVDPVRLEAALRATIRSMGGTILRHRVNGLRFRDGGIGVALADGGGRDADAVVVAAGIGSREIMAAPNVPVPMIAERGYHVQAQAPDWPCRMPPIVFEDRALIVTRFDRGVRAASFVEFARGSRRPDAAKWQRISGHVAALGLPFEAPFATWMGARPTLPDYLPAIGRSRRHPALFYAFGHQHLGLTLGPLTGELVGALLAGDDPVVPVAPFDLARFR